ncbi:unnamed protein product [Allacma fusca]|uniref:N-acetyltransferase domain-containing protein n=1 Tax=Allacma fusca TaxID=39272 RepID=A0A8J2LAX8_9HEXA|nr:unnamed protein product [Allacma fusca]
MRNLICILDMAEEKANLYEKCKVEHYADWLLVSVEKKYRGRGLAQELYKRSVHLAKERGLPLIKCVFSSPYSRKAGANLGFEELSSFNFTDALDENGKKFLPNATPDQKVTLGVLTLKQECA